MRFACSCAEENGQHSVRQYFDKYDPIVSRSAYAEAKKRKESTGSFAYVRSDLIGGAKDSTHRMKCGQKRLFSPAVEKEIRAAACAEYERKTEAQIAEIFKHKSKTGECHRSTIHRILHEYAVEAGEKPCSIVKVS